MQSMLQTLVIKIYLIYIKVAYFCLNETNYLTKLDKFTVVLSSLVHDIGHPGVNNAFLVLVQSNHAIKCNY